MLSRIFAIETPLPAAKKEISALQAGLTPAKRAGDYAQAMMDLGATICSPKRPACSLCPWETACVAHSRGTEELFPRKAAKTDRPERAGAAFVASRPDGAILLRKRAERGLLGGMTEVPGSDWVIGPAPAPGRDAAPLAADWQRVAAPVIHVFTHFRLTLDIWHARLPEVHPAPGDAWWASAADLPHEALPSVMKKAIEAAVPGATRKRK